MGLGCRVDFGKGWYMFVLFTFVRMQNFLLQNQSFIEAFVPQHVVCFKFGHFIRSCPRLRLVLAASNTFLIS